MTIKRCGFRQILLLLWLDRHFVAFTHGLHSIYYCAVISVDKNVMLVLDVCGNAVVTPKTVSFFDNTVFIWILLIDN